MYTAQLLITVVIAVVVTIVVKKPHINGKTMPTNVVTCPCNETHECKHTWVSPCVLHGLPT